MIQNQNNMTIIMTDLKEINEKKLIKIHERKAVSPVSLKKTMNITVFRDVEPYSLVENDRRFRSAHCLHYQGDRLVQPPRR
jgi:hypothetical protein